MRQNPSLEEALHAQPWPLLPRYTLHACTLNHPLSRVFERKLGLCTLHEAMCPTRAAALGASIALSLLLVSSTAHAAASQNDSDAGGASATAATVAAAAAGAAEVLPPGDQAQQDLLKWALGKAE